MTSRGVLYLVWGQFDRALLDRAINSVREFHPDLPVEIARLGDDATLLDKAGMLDLTPFDETVFLDADTVVLGDLGFGFDKASRQGLACSICECPWARRYGGIDGDIVEYNTGVLFFTKDAKPVFDAWKARVRDIDSSIVFRSGDGLARMPLNDQAGFAMAIEETGFNLFVLPYNWNFRPKWHKSWYGPLKIWHDYEPVPEPIRQRNADQAALSAIIDLSILRDD